MHRLLGLCIHTSFVGHGAMIDGTPLSLILNDPAMWTRFLALGLVDSQRQGQLGV